MVTVNWSVHAPAAVSRNRDRKDNLKVKKMYKIRLPVRSKLSRSKRNWHMSVLAGKTLKAHVPAVSLAG